MRLQLHTPVGEMDLLLKITGEFNVYNVYILFKSSIYAVFIVNNRLFTVCLHCLHFQILYVYIFYAYASFVYTDVAPLCAIRTESRR